MQKTIGIRLPDWMLDKLDDAAKRRMVTRSDLVRFAVNKYLEEEPPKHVRHSRGRTPKSDKGSRRRASVSK